MELLENGRLQSNGNETQILSQNYNPESNENISEEKNRTEYLKENFSVKLEKYLHLKEQYYCCCSINIWMLTIAAFTIITAIKTQIALLVNEGFAGGVIHFILIFPVWISGILAIFAYICEIPLLISPFIIYLVISAYFIIFFTIFGIQIITLVELYIAFRWYINAEALKKIEESAEKKD
uniref:Transmembrane protein n=1 Tax=Onchocerca volvulus TaxID=6282 RepID=A0A8R1XWM4_ONCVO